MLFGLKDDRVPSNAIRFTPEIVAQLDAIRARSRETRQQALESAVEAWLATARMASAGGHIELVAPDGTREIIGAH